MYLLPGNTPHCPVRFADTVGIVVEQDRPAKSSGIKSIPSIRLTGDRIRWYCEGCKQIVHEEVFHMTDLGTQVKQAVETFNGDEGLRKCNNCGIIAKTK
jgi:3-hydroxyanthranilate 3,4-dioxygenase